MLSFIRKWFILLALLIWSLTVLTARIADKSNIDPILELILLTIPSIAAAVLLATRGLRETTTLRVTLCIYAIFLIPSGLLMWASDVTDNINNPGSPHDWTNTKFWLNLSLELGVILSPLVIGMGYVFASIYNKVFWRLWEER